MAATRRLKPGTMRVTWFLNPERIRQVRMEAIARDLVQSEIVEEALDSYFGRSIPKSIRNMMAAANAPR